MTFKEICKARFSSLHYEKRCFGGLDIKILEDNICLFKKPLILISKKSLKHFY